MKFTILLLLYPLALFGQTENNAKLQIAEINYEKVLVELNKCDHLRPPKSEQELAFYSHELGDSVNDYNKWKYRQITKGNKDYHILDISIKSALLKYYEYLHLENNGLLRLRKIPSTLLWYYGNRDSKDYNIQISQRLKKAIVNLYKSAIANTRHCNNNRSLLDGVYYEFLVSKKAGGTWSPASEKLSKLVVITEDLRLLCLGKKTIDENRFIKKTKKLQKEFEKDIISLDQQNK